MPVRGGRSETGGDVLGQVEAVVVARCVPGQCDETQCCDRQRRSEDGRGPPDDRCADSPPASAFGRALWFTQSEATCDGENGRNERNRDGDRDEQPHGAGDPDRLEDGHPGQAEAQHCSGDRQSGTQDHRCDASERGVIRGFRILAGPPRLVIPADEKYPVVGPGRHRKRHQQRDTKGR